MRQASARHLIKGTKRRMSKVMLLTYKIGGNYSVNKNKGGGHLARRDRSIFEYSRIMHIYTGRYGNKKREMLRKCLDRSTKDCSLNFWRT